MAQSGEAASPAVGGHEDGAAAHAPGPFIPLAIGSIGVVFGDIGTSPLYALHEALGQASKAGLHRDDVLGVVSLALWALFLVVTVKYVIFLMRADNNGEGGVLSLMALAQRAVGGRTPLILVLGMIGAALFYGDAIITPAISVLSAVEGLRSAPMLQDWVSLRVVLIISLVVLVGLFAVQSRGTAKVGAFFGPICLVWFFVIGGLGLIAFLRQPEMLLAFSPWYGLKLMITHKIAGLLVLGSVFLTVTGAEALYADMGHFGRWPIQASWLFLVLPCLVLNYLGQGALALHAADLAAASGRAFENQDWFFLLAPPVLRLPLVLLATAATVIASQAVITGAFSLSNQAMQLGLLPRMVIERTSAAQAGQIYLPQVNMLLAVGVVLLVAIFKTSSNMAQAYGLAVTGTMVVTTSLALIVVWRWWRWSLPVTLALLVPLLTMDVVFLGANALKVLSGGWVPLTIAAALICLMAAWVRGSGVVASKLHRESLPLGDLIASLVARPPFQVSGTAVYLTADPDRAPGALMHNLKHNRVLHEMNVILSVRTSQKPRVADEDRVKLQPLAEGFVRVDLTYGFMERPNVPAGLTLCRKQGLAFDLMATSFFLGRRTIVSASRTRPLNLIFLFLAKNASNPTDFYQIPAGRVVEMGSQLSL